MIIALVTIIVTAIAINAIGFGVAWGYMAIKSARSSQKLGHDRDTQETL